MIVKNKKLSFDVSDFSDGNVIEEWLIFMGLTPYIDYLRGFRVQYGSDIKQVYFHFDEAVDESLLTMARLKFQ